MSLNNFDDIISWSQFSQLPSRPAGEDEDAHIHTAMKLNYDLGGKGKATIVSSATLDILVTPDCWVVSSEMKKDLLKHEQGHYDIQALVAREFYDKLLALSASSDADLKKKIRQLEAKFQQVTNSVNKRYDSQTDHSEITSVQQTWDKKLDAAKKNPNGTTDHLPQ